MTKVVGILLAAGLSERMGGVNKMLLDIDDSKLVQLTHKHLSDTDVHDMVVVTGRDHEAIAGLFPRHRKVVFNPDYKSGMTSSIQVGVRWFEGDVAYMVCLGDMLWLTDTDYNALIAKAKAVIAENPKAIVMPRVNGKVGNPVIFSNHYRQSILDHKAPNGCKGIVQNNQQHLAYLDSAEEAFLKDIDTPADLDQLKV